MNRYLRLNAGTAAIGMIILLVMLLVYEQFNDLTIPKDGEPIVLYTNQSGGDLRIIYEDAINRAEKSVLLMIYALNDQKIINALNYKADRGIPVTIIGDIEASAKAEHRLSKNIKYVKRDTDGIMHLKILVIDDKETWIGSANMTGESLRMHGNLVAVIASPSVAQVVKQKADSMINRSYFSGSSRHDFIVGGQRLELWFTPDESNGPRRIMELIRNSKTQLQIAMFTWTRFDFAKEVINAHRRGVAAEVILDRNSGQGAGKEVVDMFTAADVPVFLSQGNALLHYKMMYIDDNTLVNGSANWTRSAFYRNDDCFFILFDLNQEQKSVINQVWKNAYRNAREIYEKAASL